MKEQSQARQKRGRVREELQKRKRKKKTVKICNVTEIRFGMQRDVKERRKQSRQRTCDEVGTLSLTYVHIIGVVEKSLLFDNTRNVMIPLLG